MEALAPSLNCILQVTASLEGGLGVKPALLNYIRKNKDPFSQQVSEWLRLKEQGGATKEYKNDIDSAYRRTLLSVFGMGLEGLPILDRLKELEVELVKVGRSELDTYIRRLPLVSLFPLLFLQLPALLLIILHPVLEELLLGLNS